MESTSHDDSPDPPPMVDIQGYGNHSYEEPDYMSVESYEASTPPEIHGGRMITSITDVNREFLHIIVRSSNDNLFNQSKQKRPMVTCDTIDGPFMTKWSLHFYPDGHPSNYIAQDIDNWFPQPQRYIPPEERFASLYVRLKEGYEMVEARMMTTVLSGDADTDAAIATNMERFMLCPRMKVDEFHKDAAGHGWPKLCPTESLKRFHGSFMCVVSLQVLQPATDMNLGSDISRQPPILINKYKSAKDTKPFIMTSLRESTVYTDAVLQANDWQSVRAHRFVLVKSPFFRRKIMEDQGVPFVYKTDHSLFELNLLLDMIYTGKLPKRTETLSKILLRLAILYELPVMTHALQDDEHRFGGFSDQATSFMQMTDEESAMQVDMKTDGVA